METDKMIRIPPSIKPGDTIGIAAPSFGATTEPYASRLKNACLQLKNRGYKIIEGECCKKSDGHGISTNPKDAARELMDFYLSPKINAIISCGGGELMCETAGFLDFEKLKSAPPKWFIGCSDNTNFIYPMAVLAETAGIYGQNAPGFGKPWEQSELDAIALLEGKTRTVSGYTHFQDPTLTVQDPLSPYIFTNKKTLTVFNPNKKNSSAPLKIEGTLLGGCLDCLCNLCGTKLDGTVEFIARRKNIIWLLESCDLSIMAIRRALWQLKSAGWFKNAALFLIGRPLASFNKEAFGLNSHTAVTGILEDLKVPVVLDADFGHIDPAIPAIIGAETQVTVQNNNITLNFTQ